MALSKKALTIYQKGWYQRKKNGLVTRLHPILSFEERKNHIKRNAKKYQDQKQKELNALRRNFCGYECFFCKRTIHLTTHRKDGSAHEEFLSMKKSKLLSEFRSGNYVNLCYACHKGVHWVMLFFGLNWDQISSTILSNENIWKDKIINMNYSRKTSTSKQKPMQFRTLKCECGNEYPIEEAKYKYKTKMGQQTFFCSRKCVGKYTPHKYKEVKREIIKNELNTGLSGYKIAKNHGWPKRLVYYHINKIRKGA